MSENLLKPILYYINDPLCGWCYGFAPVIAEFANEFSHKVEFNVISGGMFQGLKRSSTKEFQEYCEKHCSAVVQSTGVKFGVGFLHHTYHSTTADFTSDHPSLAITVFKSFDTPHNLDFAIAVQKAIFFEGIEPNDAKHFAYLASSYGLQTQEFMEKYESPEFLHHTYQEYNLAAKLGANVFPTLLMQHNHELIKIGSGFMSKKELYKRVGAYLPWPEFNPAKADIEITPPQGV